MWVFILVCLNGLLIFIICCNIFPFASLILLIWVSFLSDSLAKDLPTLFGQRTMFHWLFYSLCFHFSNLCSDPYFCLLISHLAHSYFFKNLSSMIKLFESSDLLDVGSSYKIPSQNCFIVSHRFLFLLSFNFRT